MKRLLFTITLMLLTSVFILADDAAQATFNTRVHDFGIIDEGKGPVSVTFEFTNTGDKPLIIVNALASCGCTKPEYPTAPIKPGKKGKIKVTYSPVGRPGAFRKTIKVVTNGNPRQIPLIIEGTVKPKGKKK